jgi:hypothetical protein
VKHFLNVWNILTTQMPKTSRSDFGNKQMYSRPCNRYESTSGNACTAIRILNFGTRGSWVASFTLRRLYFGERALDINWTGGCVGPIVGLGAVKKKTSLKKIMCRTNTWRAAQRNTCQLRSLWLRLYLWRCIKVSKVLRNMVTASSGSSTLMT